ncbi:MAG: shikimate kinase [Clostridia bacterium]|nr:shikimate kinase [Clostridia bacterium]
MNVVLFGMMGAGKTTVALALSRLTGKSRVDTDEEIVKKYGPIKEIFSTFGEGRFRELETETARSLSRQKNLIIATGGGFVLNPENVAFLKENGALVYLRAEKETLVKRLKGESERPLLEGEERLESKIERLLGERGETYERVAEYVIDVDKKTPEQIAREIVEKLGINS